jgi:hypothetical protein
MKREWIQALPNERSLWSSDGLFVDKLWLTSAKDNVLSKAVHEIDVRFHTDGPSFCRYISGERRRCLAYVDCVLGMLVHSPFVVTDVSNVLDTVRDSDVNYRSARFGLSIFCVFKFVGQYALAPSELTTIALTCGCLCFRLPSIGR